MSISDSDSDSDLWQRLATEIFLFILNTWQTFPVDLASSSSNLGSVKLAKLYGLEGKDRLRMHLVVSLGIFIAYAIFKVDGADSLLNYK